MDIATLSSAASGSVGAAINVALLKATQNLDQSEAALLFASIGLGQSVNALA